MMTVMNECTPAPHGCRRYFEKPGCDGTLIFDGPLPYPLPPGSCAIRVQ